MGFSAEFSDAGPEGGISCNYYSSVKEEKQFLGAKLQGSIRGRATLKVCGDGIKMGSFGTGTAVRRSHSKVKIGTGGFNATSRLPLRAECSKCAIILVFYATNIPKTIPCRHLEY